ncbi:uncharacterized protein METZ01_LOCUS257393, partial [marine metagenome]
MTDQSSDKTDAIWTGASRQSPCPTTLLSCAYRRLRAS